MTEVDGNLVVEDRLEFVLERRGGFTQVGRKRRGREENISDGGSFPRKTYRDKNRGERCLRPTYFEY